jgi:hypothetical protein
LGRIHWDNDNTTCKNFSAGHRESKFFSELKIDNEVAGLLKALPGAPIFPEAVFEGAPGALNF